MKTSHLSEDAIQQYILDAPGCEADLIEHIGSCETCKTRLANYRSIFEVIQMQPGPVFEFDVAGLILSQIPEKKKNPAGKDWPLYILVSAVFSLMGWPLYWLRKDIAIMFAGTLPIAISLITIPATLIFLFQGIELFNKYKRRSDALNY